MPIAKYNTKGTLKQDLIAARAELKQFRHDVALLKRKGLLDKKIYDARSVVPSKYLKSQIKQFGNVLKGLATPVKISKEKGAYYKEKGYTIKAGRVIVPHAPNEKVIGTHGNFVTKTQHPTGSITKIDIGFKAKNINEWIEKIKKIKVKENERLSIQFFGNNSMATHGSPALLLEFLQHYELFEQATDENQSSGAHKKQNQFIENIVILRVDRGIHMPKSEPSDEKRAEYREKARRRRENWLLQLTPAQMEKEREREADKQRLRRLRLKQDSDPTQLLKERKAARIRAQKSRNIKKGKI